MSGDVDTKIVIETGSRVSIDEIKGVFYLVMGLLCQCGGRKGRGQPFCAACMNKLCAPMRNRLYVMIRRSFVLSYQEASKSLPVAPPSPCECGCGEEVAFPWRFRQGHQRVKGFKQKAARPASAPSGPASGADESQPSTTLSSGVERSDKQ